MLPRPLRGFDILLCIAYEARPTVQCIAYETHPTVLNVELLLTERHGVWHMHRS